jgi:hypothetical protein
MRARIDNEAMNTTTKGTNMTARQFAAKIESMLRDGHPDANITIEWVWPTAKGDGYKPRRPRFIQFRTGYSGFVGMVRVSADGYRTRVMQASGGGDLVSMMVR